MLVLCTRFDLRQIIVTVSLLLFLDSSNLFQIIVNSFDDTSTERQYQLPTTLDVELIYNVLRLRRMGRLVTPLLFSFSINQQDEYKQTADVQRF